MRYLSHLIIYKLSQSLRQHIFAFIVQYDCNTQCPLSWLFHHQTKCSRI